MKYLIFTISVLLFLSCEKNNTFICEDISCLEVECEPSDCINLSDSISDIRWEAPKRYYPNEYIYDYSHNPNNQSQFVNTYYKDSIYGISISDGNNYVFSTDLPTIGMFTVEWGADRKIMICNNYEIWVINENGDSLRNLVPYDGVNRNFGADWSTDGKQIIFSRMREDSLIIRTYKLEVNNNKLEYVGNLSSIKTVWSPNGKYLAYDIYETKEAFIGELYFYDIEKQIETKIFNSQHNGIYSLDWYDNENIIWSDADGVFITNINTKDTRWLRKTCGNISYGILEVDKNKNVYVNKSFWSLTNNNLDYYIEPYIYQIDISSCMEQEVEL